MPIWYVVVHRANAGPRVRAGIEDLDTGDGEGFAVHWPRYVFRAPRQDDVIRPLYPGYLFARVPDGESWGRIKREVPGVIRLLEESGRPVPVPDALVQRHIERAGGRLDGWIDETPESRSRYRAKQRLQVVSGPFEGWVGVCQMDDGDDRIRVLMDMLGGPRPVTLPRDAVAPASSK